MIFASTQIHEQNNLSIEVAFDPALIRDFHEEQDENRFFMFSYDMDKGGLVQAGCFPVSEAVMIVEYTPTRVYVSGCLYVDSEKEYMEPYLPYIVDDVIEYHAYLTQEEQTQILLAILCHQKESCGQAS